MSAKHVQKVLAPEFSAIEKEVILLKAAIDTIRDMMNVYSVNIHRSNGYSEISFADQSRSAYFNIILGDLLSNRRAFGEHPHLVAELMAICNSPNFNFRDSVIGLHDEVTAFNNWLETEITLSIPIPDSEAHGDLRITRVELLKISGNVLKHSFTRLDSDAKKLGKIWARTGHKITWQSALFGIQDLYEHFHANIFLYHASTIGEFLNNIWWGIQVYMQAQLEKSIVRNPADVAEWRIRIPDEIVNQYARYTYNKLMQQLMSRPIIPRFSVHETLKLRY